MAAETFILKFLSPETLCSAHELRFTAEPSDVAATIDAEESDLKHGRFDLEPADLLALSGAFGLLMPESVQSVRLERPHSIDAAPYLVHTNFELPLMLDGRKPLSYFCPESDEWLAKVRVPFIPHVASGLIVERIIKRSVTYPTTSGGTRTLQLSALLYVLPGEEWRIDPFMSLLASPAWTEEQEREQGRLFGYSKDECDWWIANRFRKRAGANPSA
ncbi:hypothetical protein ACIQUB_10030 [Rhizobium sp. NPDC090275]|uniref:hypothetical protein n=1 Tax=Rhizobium sp. NPDC090275 TaxID=3364498 RepID=UPI000DDC7A27